MPVIELHLLRGYDDTAKDRLCRALTDAVRQVVPAPPDAITVMLTEHGTADWMRGGERRKPTPALPDPAILVLGYLAAMEARDLEAARRHLAPGFEMRFPGAAPMHCLDELIAWAAPRYRSVAKAVEGTEIASAGDATVVWVTGTLHGEWPDGSAFEGIRFVDRFELRGGLIMRQDVWNDIGEVRRLGDEA
ncbi:MAG: nuclear transport factor 2 family protein [Pseudomonadota bacterium]